MESAPRFEHKKSLGQHFLRSGVVPAWMCDAASLAAGETVVEVGPGTGALTREILARGATVIALEADPRAIAALEVAFAKEITEGTLTVMHADVRTFDLATLALPNGGYKVVSNIPYYLTGRLFRTFLEHPAKPRCIVFLVQKEVAKRATASLARGEKESLLSLSIKLYGTPHYVRAVPRGHFTPPPAVDSAIILIDNITDDRTRDLDTVRFFRDLHLGFGKKRKQLLGNLAEAYPRETLISIFTKLGIREDVRAEDLDISVWCDLVCALTAAETDD